LKRKESGVILRNIPAKNGIVARDAERNNLLARIENGVAVLYAAVTLVVTIKKGEVRGIGRGCGCGGWSSYALLVVGDFVPSMMWGGDAIS
jgi:hypothetical protein